MKNSFYFGKWIFAASNFQNSCFFFKKNPLGFFHHCFFRCFRFSPLIFTTGFWVFLLLIALVHVTNFLYPDCFFAAFLSGTSFFALLHHEYYGFEEAFLIFRCFLSYALSAYLPQYREFYGFERAFYTHRHNLLLSRLPSEQAVLPWRLQDLPLRFEIQTRPIYMFESHSVQQKVV